MGFKIKSFDGGWIGGVNSIQVFFDFLIFFNFAKKNRRGTTVDETLQMCVGHEN